MFFISGERKRKKVNLQTFQLKNKINENQYILLKNILCVFNISYFIFFLIKIYTFYELYERYTLKIYLLAIRIIHFKISVEKRRSI